MSQRPPRVLLGDDDDALRMFVREMLEQRGVEVVGEASDGPKAVALARDLQPDVAVLDLVMPGGGLGALSEIRAGSPGTRIVVLSSFGAHPTWQELEEADAHVAKSASSWVDQLLSEIGAPS